MNIKNVKPTVKSGFRQGYYKPKNIHKYKGAYPIIYRSSWERKFCHWCDYNDNVIFWMSEPFQVKYYNILDKKDHVYFPDFLIKLKENNQEKNYVVEIKPKSQLQKPKLPQRKTIKSMKNFKYGYEMYVKNYCKNQALKKICESRNMGLMLLTEDSKLF